MHFPITKHMVQHGAVRLTRIKNGPVQSDAIRSLYRELHQRRWYDPFRRFEPAHELAEPHELRYAYGDAVAMPMIQDYPGGMVFDEFYDYFTSVSSHREQL